ncbi:MAG: aminotransferase class I/II-fold pyridoxal phosphate-dependent enzyme [Nocardioides sp.]
MRASADRLSGIPPTIFSEMSALAVRTGAVNLGQGFPDQDGPKAVVLRAVAALESGQNQYPPGIGRPELRQAIARHQARNYGIELDPDSQVVVTTGCTEAIAGAILGLVNPGDPVVVLEPYYDSYLAMIQIAGGVRRPVTLRSPDFRLDVPELERAASGAQVLLINTPHNPTGTVLNGAELATIADVARRHDLIVITDEVYEHLVFDDHRHIPLSTLPGMFDRTVTLSSVGKSYSFTGWKVGWATGPPDLVAAVLGAKQWLSFTSGAPLQPAVAVALDQETDFPKALAADLQRRRDLLAAGLRAAGLQPRRSEGTYFTTTDISHLGWPDGREFCLALPERAGVVAIPSMAFYDDLDEGRHLVRWAFCKDADMIAQGVERLAKADLTR